MARHRTDVARAAATATIERPPVEALDEVIRRNYCICGPDGVEQPDRLRKAREALADAHFDIDKKVSLPEIDSVPRLKATIADVSQVPALVRTYLPRVEADPRLHALSFVDPLSLATDHLGIAIRPAVARLLRRQLRGMVTFDPSRSLAPDGNGLHGIAEIHWRPARAEGQ